MLRISAVPAGARGAREREEGGMTQQPAQQPSPDPLGALVRRIREHELLLSQSDLAWLAGVSRGTISNLETGRVTPDARTWHRIRTALALPPIPLEQGWEGIPLPLVIPAEAVQGILDAILAIRNRDAELGRRAAERWRRLVVQLTREDGPVRPATGAELSWLANDVIPAAPPDKMPAVYAVLRAWGWAPDTASANTELVPRSQTGGFRQVQELVSTVTDVTDQLRGYQDRMQLFDRLPERVRDHIARGLVISSDVTTPQTSPEISIINLIVMQESDSSLAAQHETHDAALRWSTILAVATHIVEQQAPDLPPKEIIKALKAGLDAQSPADVRELLPQASVGDPPAMYRLARLLKQNGRPDESERWLRSAAEAGHPGALYTLGMLAFEQGRHREAELWLRGAADAGHADAMYSLWILLREEDRLTARAWLRKAADAGNRDAMYELWTLHQGRDEREAERWLRRAANNGHRQALADLGRLAAERGAEDDAVRWLRRAAEEGDSSAMSQYELMLFGRRRRERGPARHAG
jgi:TPR repeat protein/DNA-binding XRE family transcriptional regulator